MGRELGAPEGLYLLRGGGGTWSPGKQQSYNRHSPGPGSGRSERSTWGALSPVSAGPCPLHVSVDLRPEEGQNTPRGHTVSQEVSRDKKELPVPWFSHL